MAPDRRAALIARLQRERVVEETHRGTGLWQALANPVLWQLALLWFLNAVCAYTFGFWAPQILKATTGLPNSKVGLVSAALTLVSIPFMLIWASHSDRRGERRLHVAVGGVVTSLGFLGAALLHQPSLAVLAQAIIWIGINSQNGPFWSLPATFLSEEAAAGGIATISSVAFMGGFIGPNVFGRLIDTYNGYTTGLALLALTELSASALAFRLRHMPAFPK